MDKKFQEKYGVYDGVKVDTFKHIPEISCYNHNYYVGLKRDGYAKPDLLFAESDDDNLTEWYILKGDSSIYIGYEFTDEGIIHLCDNNY